MSQVVFDTLEYAQTLQAAGLTQTESEALARANAAAFRQMLEAKDIATKKDLALLKMELIRWMVGSNMALAAFLVAALAWLKP